MILQQLYQDAERILGQTLPPAMYKPLAVRWVIPLTLDGRLAGSIWVRVGDAKRGAEHIVPYLMRTSGPPRPFLIVDDASYVLGIGDAKSRPDQKHAAYRLLIKQCLESTNNALVRAVDLYLDRWDAQLETGSLPPELFASDRVAFTVDGAWPTDQPDVQVFWANATTSPVKVPTGQCLITGLSGPIEKTLPGMLKGIPGGQKAGVAMISANKPAFESFGRENAYLSPISHKAAERFTNALNHLLSGSRSSIRVTEVVYVFWTRSGPDESVWGFLGADPDPTTVKNLISSSWTGQRQYTEGIKGEEKDFYALALSASGARAVVRDWLHTTVPSVRERLADWFIAQEIVAGDGGPAKYYGARNLASSLYRELKDIPRHVVPMLVHSALHGDPLPKTLLAQAVLRTRMEQRLTHPRAALIKAILVLQEETTKRREIAKSMRTLDPNHPSPAYHCGRLLAELDVIQRAALGKINTTLVDRYYGAASATPGLVFGILLTHANKAHLPKIRKTKPTMYGALQRRIEEILAPLNDNFPKTLTLQDQAIFSLGFYHQRAEDRARAIAARSAREQGKATPEQAVLADAVAEDQVQSSDEEETE